MYWMDLFFVNIGGRIGELTVRTATKETKANIQRIGE
jgi:hypothetical protein